MAFIQVITNTKFHFLGPKQGNNQRGKIPHLLKCVGLVLDPPKSENNGGKTSSSLSPFFLSSCFRFFLSFFLFFLSFSLSFFSSCLQIVWNLSSNYQVGLTLGSTPNTNLFDTWSTQDQVFSMPQFQPLSCSCMRVA